MDHKPRTEAEQAAFFETALQAALAAEDAAGRLVVHLTVADIRIDLVFAGPALLTEFLPALQHLVTDASEPASTVFHVWEGQSTGVPMPPPPCRKEHFTDRGDLWGFTSPRYRAAFHWIECSVNCFDRERGIGVFWVQQRETLPYWTKASPFRSLLHWALERTGAQLMHAAAVGTGEGAVLITGRGGVGKSSTALAGLEDGLLYAADDYLAVRLDPEPCVYSLYSTAKLNAEDVARFPRLAPLVGSPPGPDEKAVLRLFPDLQSQIMPRMKLRAVMTPRVAQQTESELRPVDAGRLRRAAAFTTLSQLPYAGQHTQQFVEEMVDRLPGFEIVLGSDRKHIVSVIRQTLARPDHELAALAAQGESRAVERDLPLISVIIPVYNGARFLADAVSNVLAQDYPSLEIIVVDDGSTDDIAGAVSRLPVDVRFFRQENAGPAAARNRGLRDASGQFIAFLDVDDLWPAGNLAMLSRVLAAEPGLMVVHGHAQMLMLDPVTGQFRPEGNPAESFPYYIGAGLYRREVFESVGPFDASMRFAEDTDWYTRLKESGLPAERLPQVTLEVRRHGANMTAQKTREELSATSLFAFKNALERARRAAAAGIQPAHQAPKGT